MHAEPNIRDEDKMIASILDGNTELYHELIRPYESTVYKMALSFMKNEADAEDVAQEAFLKAFRKLTDFRGSSKFSTWLISITLNEARGRLRHQNVLRMESIDSDPDEAGYVAPAMLRDWREIPSQALERKEIRTMLRAAVEGLAPIYREVLMLRDVEEFSTDETAKALEITTASVKVRLHRARIALQKTLAPQLKSLNPRRRWFQWS
jgi:RNA polymerase sigma-70 factor (ECF subfamily)